MTITHLHVSRASVRNLKTEVQTHLSHVSSAHLSEALAASMGFRTHAALLAALSANATVAVPVPDNEPFCTRLKELGYSDPPGGSLRSIPDLTRSHTPLKTFPIKPSTGLKARARRNILVAAINAGLDQGVFGLSPGENWWPNAATSPAGWHYRFTFDGDCPAAVRVNDYRGVQLCIVVVLNPRKDEFSASDFESFRDGDAHVEGWLERALGVWIHHGEGIICRRRLLNRAAAAAVEPRGFSDCGPFIF